MMKTTAIRIHDAAAKVIILANLMMGQSMTMKDVSCVGIGGATNAITYSTDLLGDITLIGPGAGRIETGYAIIGDILSFSH